MLVQISAQIFCCKDVCSPIFCPWCRHGTLLSKPLPALSELRATEANGKQWKSSLAQAGAFDLHPKKCSVPVAPSVASFLPVYPFLHRDSRSSLRCSPCATSRRRILSFSCGVFYALLDQIVEAVGGTVGDVGFLSTPTAKTRPKVLGEVDGEKPCLRFLLVHCRLIPKSLSVIQFSYRRCAPAPTRDINPHATHIKRHGLQHFLHVFSASSPRKSP